MIICVRLICETNAPYLLASTPSLCAVAFALDGLGPTEFLQKGLNLDAKRVVLDELPVAEELKPARNDVGEPFIFSQSFSRVLHSLARPRNPLHLSSNSPRTCLEETSTPFPPHRPLASSTTPSTWSIQCAQVHNCRLEIASNNKPPTEHGPRKTGRRQRHGYRAPPAQCFSIAEDSYATVAWEREREEHNCPRLYMGGRPPN